MSKPRLVWSDDPKDKLLVDHGDEVKVVEASVEFVAGKTWTAVFRIEKGGRGGKTVTVIDQLPKQDAFLNDLCRELKSKCGSGGTYSLVDGCIEIQGDKRAAIKVIFDKKGIRYRGM